LEPYRLRNQFVRVLPDLPGKSPAVGGIHNAANSIDRRRLQT
jgi:hypothetical protein